MHGPCPRGTPGLDEDSEPQVQPFLTQGDLVLQGGSVGSEKLGGGDVPRLEGAQVVSLEKVALGVAGYIQ